MQTKEHKMEKKKNISKIEVFCSVFHGVALLHHVYAMGYTFIPIKDFNKVTDQRVLDMKNFEMRFFTTWNLIIQAIYFGIAVLFDLQKYWPQIRLPNKMLELKGYIFTTFVFPCSAFVALMFWTLYYINREFVLPEVLDDYVPSWLNHSVHTNIVPFILLELLVAKHPVPSTKSSIFGITAITIAYNIVYFHTYYQCGRWIYALFYVLSWTERIALIVCNYFMSLGFLKIGSLCQQYKYKLSRNNCRSKYEKYKKDLLMSNPIYSINN